MKIHSTDSRPAPGLLVNLVIAYDSLLQRYARRLIKDAGVAGLLVSQVFELYYAESQQGSITEVRLYLKLHTERLCRRWLDLRDGVPTSHN